MALIAAERQRQSEQWGAAHDPGDAIWLAVLTEEVGEVAHELTYRWPEPPMAGFLAQELVHVAAVCVAWLEAIDRRPEDDPGDE